MKTPLAIVAILCALVMQAHAQNKTEKAPAPPVWTEADRKYLLDNLQRSKEEILNETKNLTKEQWNFKENPDRWSINQIVEHIAIWELLFMREISVALQRPADPHFAGGVGDSLFVDNDPKGVKKGNALEYTWPFSYAIPLGNNEGKNNVTWLMVMRDESIDYLKKGSENIRQHYSFSGASVHQVYMMIFSHSFRHLRQIRKVKEHPQYPK